MSTYSLTHLSDRDLLGRLASLVAQDRITTAEILAHIAEVDARKLYLPAGFPSMHLYCVHALHFSDEAAYKRIHAARAAREFPAIFQAVAEGRLHLSAVIMMAPHLRRENAAELIEAATHKTKSEIEQHLAERFPRSESLPMVIAVPPSVPRHESVAGESSSSTSSVCDQHAPGRVETLQSRVAPIAPERFALNLSMGRSTYDKLRHAQDLMSHQIPSGDMA
jgi:hypothetical protein